MADKSVGELIAAQSVTPTDLFVLEQNGTAKKLTGQILENWLVSFADGHGGIQSIEKIGMDVLADTYRITLSDTTTFDFVVTNGRGINSIVKTSTSGLIDTYTITFNDDTEGTFTVTNGEKGDKGDNTYIWIKYASQEPTAQSNSFGDVPDNWIGIYFGGLSEAPTDWKQYAWFQIKGGKGDPGEPATLTRSEITYKVGDSGTVIPSGAWSSGIPTVTPGRYLWTRQVLQFNTGEPIISYSVSRYGIDGTGAVSTVNGAGPDLEGNVAIDAASVKAVPIAGGTMEGSINMNGQKLSGLNAPTADDEAVNKGYADNLKPDLTGYATETYVDDAVKEAAPYNYADNSDFTQFIAQAGIGGLHGTQAYAGDRWILDGGTVTGEANENGNGYRNITLNGTMRQIIANPPAAGTVFVEMVSGTAMAVYENGEVTITSAGGVIKNVSLYDGTYTTENMPAYQPKGYGAELAECQRYYYKTSENIGRIANKTGTAYPVHGSGVTIYFPVTMRIRPTVTIAYDINDSAEITASPLWFTANTASMPEMEIAANTFFDLHWVEANADL